eukprot:4831961-Prymnesium_polylepis.1
MKHLRHRDHAGARDKQQDARVLAVDVLFVERQARHVQRFHRPRQPHPSTVASSAGAVLVSGACCTKSCCRDAMQPLCRQPGRLEIDLDQNVASALIPVVRSADRRVVALEPRQWALRVARLADFRQQGRVPSLRPHGSPAPALLNGSAA